MARSYRFVQELAKEYEASLKDLMEIVQEFESEWDQRTELVEQEDSCELMVIDILPFLLTFPTRIYYHVQLGI